MVIGDEPLGTKNKFWCECAGERWLFKEIRKISDSEFSGEDWSEKVAAEIARVLGIPAARVELSVCSGRRGCVSKNFTSADQQLVHGNEVLAAYVSANYEQSKNYGQAGHTLESIFAALGAIFPETGQRRKAMRQFADYCVLDALIGNVDRHHENWGVLWQVVRTGDLDASEMNREHDIAGQYQLAPSYDHASSLGRELTDKKRGGSAEKRTGFSVCTSRSRRNFSGRMCEGRQPAGARCGGCSSLSGRLLAQFGPLAAHATVSAAAADR